MDKNKLDELIELEKQVEEIPFNRASELEIKYHHKFLFPLKEKDIKRIKVELIYNGQSFFTLMNRTFIHQIGKRIYENKKYGNDYKPLFKQWVEDFNISPKQFTQKIINAITSHELIMKYFSFSKNKIYGFVSDKFQPTDQKLFRERFITLCIEDEAIKIDTSRTRMHQNKNSKLSPVKEYFGFDVGSKYVDFSSGLVYGLNNGYGAYSVHWVREIKDSKTWLSPYKFEADFAWKNNPRNHSQTSNEEMLKFVDFVKEQGIDLAHETDKKIMNAMETLINENEMLHFFKLLRIAKGTKQRLKTKLYEEMKDKSNTIFAFSEAIRGMGTFDKYISKSTKRLFIEVGTRLLEDNEFQIIINNGIEIKLHGSYQWY